uniref:Uncharacterized protein n=1 Tax=Amphimedon queenslandica TaxID=400682 RepID=A0A1X7V495_AMPQE
MPNAASYASRGVARSMSLHVSLSPWLSLGRRDVLSWRSARINFSLINQYRDYGRIRGGPENGAGWPVRKKRMLEAARKERKKNAHRFNSHHKTPEIWTPGPLPPPEQKKKGK